MKKIRSEKEILPPERARSLAAGFKRYVPAKIFYVLPALAVFALAFFVGRGYWQPYFYTQQPNQSIVQLPVEDKVEDSTHEVQSQDAGVKIPDSPDPRITDAVPEPPQIPVTPPVTVSHARHRSPRKRDCRGETGATLYSIAYQYYKVADETFIDHILKLNPKITNPNLILVSQKIKMPEITESLLIVHYSEGLHKVHLRTFRNLKSAAKYRRDVCLTGKRGRGCPVESIPGRNMVQSDGRIVCYQG